MQIDHRQQQLRESDLAEGSRSPEALDSASSESIRARVD